MIIRFQTYMNTSENYTYPKEIVKKAVDKLNQYMLESKGLYGEFGNKNDSEINQGSLSHKILEVSFDEGNIIYGKLETLDTYNGKMLEERFNDKVELLVKPRGLSKIGDTLDKKATIEDYMIITLDVSLKSMSTIQGDLKLDEYETTTGEN